ncbi:adenylyltransferase/cytidyltransferase family protein [Actinomycetospora termitidis]|uniref:Adenylyltransferase/cytidyltransferase family protein n=1 Tax=Actinomycetospora termitidis TaxID=3053470 RepID=A0ABT7MCC7_9PSEU|nr:adenylyltransferase/cytidyltransferase family protein [Actinomycetospora sp. Odt1-22]MDL5158298.1 adenylyltransferase/cytidyltransferase family protein [Actinomycetospora sp. Odt1-22]
MTLLDGLAAVTGRFQPVHDQHLELFALALEAHDELVVAVTNPDSGARRPERTSDHRHTDAANPFTYYERVRLLRAALAGAGLAERAVVVPFDLTRPHLWPEYVPSHAVQYVRAYSAWERDKAAQLGSVYPVQVLDGDPTTKLDATDIRARFDDGSWVDLVPPSTVPVLRSLL